MKILSETIRFLSGYMDKFAKVQKKTGMPEAVKTAVGQIGGVRTVVGVLDNRFLMGSMGVAVGEKITRAVEYAEQNRLPLVTFSTSGGARMQEGIYSLMQMAKTAAAVKSYSEAGLLYISVMTNPTTGGVTASFASLGDIIIAEPGALIGFAGTEGNRADNSPKASGRISVVRKSFAEWFSGRDCPEEGSEGRDCRPSQSAHEVNLRRDVCFMRNKEICARRSFKYVRKV